METKICSSCGIEKQLNEFFKARLGKHGRRAECKACSAAADRKRLEVPEARERKRVSIRRYQNTPRGREITRTLARKRYHKLTFEERTAIIGRTSQVRREWKARVVELYGSICACCAESRPLFLTIDHVNGGGKEDRRRFFAGTYGYYRWLAQQDRRDDYRLLCWNCNSGRQLNGGICPHEEERNGGLNPPINEEDNGSQRNRI